MSLLPQDEIPHLSRSMFSNDLHLSCFVHCLMNWKMQLHLQGLGWPIVSTQVEAGVDDLGPSDRRGCQPTLRPNQTSFEKEWLSFCSLSKPIPSTTWDPGVEAADKPPHVLRCTSRARYLRPRRFDEVEEVHGTTMRTQGSPVGTRSGR